MMSKERLNLLYCGSLRNCPAEREASHCGHKSVGGLSALRVGEFLGFFVSISRSYTNTLTH